MLWLHGLPKPLKPVDTRLNIRVTSPKKEAGLKGKARKAARASQASTNSSTKSSASVKPQTYLIAVRDFIPLAETIVKCEAPRVRVPSTFITAIERAISARRSHHSILGEKTRTNEDGHGHFISVLERVQNILRPLFVDENKEGLANKFEKLDVEEPSEERAHTPDTTKPELPESDSDATYEAERAQDINEMYSAYCLIIQDYRAFRIAIQETWLGYRHGVFDLVSASIMTNTALEFARQLEKDAAPLFNKFGGSAMLMEAVFTAQCHNMGEDKDFRELPGDDLNFRVWEAATEIFFPTYMFLQGFVPMVSKDNMPVIKPGYFGVYDPTSDRINKSPREKFQEDKVILLEHSTEFALLCICAPDLLAEDELTRSFAEAFQTHSVTLFLSFATQVYLDIHHTLRGDVRRGLSDLMATANMIDESINDNFQYHKSLRVTGWPRSNDTVLEKIQQFIGLWVKRDPVGEARRRLKQPPREPYMLLSSHPLLCGLITYSLKAKFQEVSLAFAGAWGSILYTYHLYNAVKQEKLLRNNWQDMDVIMGMQDKIFVGDRPQTPEDYLKQFALSMGWSAAAFSKNRRQGALPVSSRGPRTLKELAPVAQMFKPRFCEGALQRDWTMTDIEQIISKSNWSWDEEASPSEGIRVYSMSRNIKKEQKKATSGAVNAAELLKQLRNTLRTESLELSIPYLSFHRICWSVLRSIHEHCRPTLRDMFGGGYMERENQLPFVVGYIFMAATNTKKLSGLLGAKKSDEVTSKLLSEAAAAMDECIATVGKQCCDMLEQLNFRFTDGMDDEVEGEGDKDKNESK
ncbi:TPA_exp: Uncharacterized protein A8136_1721 [Trichophyton benhamiae CBS 112371]|uniref:DUF6604 domain-containing protein n=1 Tax=Arthroderma benhamiae (strain ATCC MYA-4681 / CBS 112371) TaxID=663331 RepID=D4AX17_ARTBC|nr:uncharacterized protein ARB_00744 [Trichophyton benhamiae CBS 112371]EFE32222.1 hypothetical protein ARB_00744 [Trichophyton benhamiae CBS 112371]DAA75324.1 TPA_exp: Uncharacterized protein A8136_1721 [Trichophyton benhamiae CBS 112371]